MYYYQSVKYDSWNEFKTNLASDLELPIISKGRYIFRGQKDENWSLISSFDLRFNSFDYKQKQHIEQTILSDFRKSCIQLYGATYENYNNVDIATLAQHYGLPTRLLDWSWSMYIATFFAFANLDIVKNEGNVAIWVLDIEHEVWNSKYGVEIIHNTIFENEHQKRQMGIFTHNTAPANSIEDYLEFCSKKVDIKRALFKIILPWEQKNLALSDLNMMGINYMNLFPDLQGCANSALLNEIIKQ